MNAGDIPTVNLPPWAQTTIALLGALSVLASALAPFAGKGRGAGVLHFLSGLMFDPVKVGRGVKQTVTGAETVPTEVQPQTPPAEILTPSNRPGPLPPTTPPA